MNSSTKTSLITHCWEKENNEKVLLKTQTSISKRWNRIVITIYCTIMLMATTVIVGWHNNIGAIIQAFHGFVPMPYNAALCFIALGVAGIGLSIHRRLLQLSGGIIAAIIGALIILEYTMGISFGIDTLFFYTGESSTEIGRMGPATAISFFLTGSALTILAIRKGNYAALGILNSVIISLALTSLIGSAFEVNYNLSFIFGPQMSVLSALAFIAFGTAMLGHAWLHADRGPDGLPKWCVYIGIAFFPALSVDTTSVLFSEQSWKIVPLEIILAVIGIVLIAFAMRGLATAKVAYKGFLLIAIPLIPLLIFAGLVVHVKQKSESAEAWALHTSEVIGTTQTLLTQVTEAESAVRGYAITQNETFLTSYNHSIGLLIPTAARLRSLVSDNPLQKAKSKKIELLMAEKLERLSDTVNIIKIGNKKQLEERVKGEEGTVLMKRLKTEIETFLQVEASLGAQRWSTLDASWQKLSWLLVTGTASAILLAGILILSFSGGIGRRLKQLQENANSLAMGKDLAPALTGKDEIAELDRVFHEMAESLKTKRIQEEHTTDILHTEELLKTGALQSAIFNSANFSSIATDANGVIQIFNVGAEHMLGYSAVEVMNKITPADISDPQEVIARAKALSLELKTDITPGFEALVFKASRGIEDIYELTYIRKDGSRFPAVVSVTALRDVQESIIGYLLIGTDNTARKLAEEKLLKTDALQNAIFNSANFSSIATDANGVIQIFNVGAERMLGYSAAEVMNKITPADISDPQEVIARAKALSLELKTDITPGFEALVFKASRGIEDIYELTYIRKDGSRFPAVVSVTALRDVQESIIGYLLIGTDITARKLAEDQLNRFFVLSLDMLCVWSVDGYFKRVNPAFTQTLGWSDEELLTRPFIDFVHPDDQTVTLREFKKQIASGENILKLENRCLHKDNSWRLLLWTSVPYADGLMFAAARDITEQKRSELAIIEAKAESEKANQAKSEFLSVMSHEIRTPLNGVIGMVDVLHQSSLKGYQVEIVDTIRSSAYSLLHIIEDILDFSKIEAGKLDIEHAPMSIEKELEAVSSMLDSMAAKKNVELTLFTHPEIPAIVLSDSKRLHQILLNLTTNAIKFSSEQDHLGKVSVQANLIKRDTKKALVEFRVSDNGIGMNKTTQNRLFTAFTQADASTTRRFGGTGLGLTIVRNLVQLMGGEISVNSKLDHGSTFIVRLPLILGKNEANNTIPEQSLVAGLTCLVIGQSNGIGDHIAAYLKFDGASVETVSNLSEARQLTEKAPQSGLWIWIFDTSNTVPLPEDIYTITRNGDIHLVLIHIQRGNRRHPRWGESKRVIEVDGNCLTRKNLLLAVAMAAGRKPLTRTRQTGKKTTSLTPPPSRAIALQHGMLILIVEDNTTNQKVIIQQLALLGFTADVASDGNEALMRWRSVEYALILTDLNMPKMDGYELTSAIRAEEKETQQDKQTIIIAITANALKGEAKRCSDIGMNDYISKPVALSKLKVLLDKWLPFTTQNNTHNDAMPIAPLDINVLKDLIGNDPKLIKEFLISFHSTATQISAEMAIAYKSENLEQLSAAAHKLKSSSRAVGALLLGELCAEIESAYKLGQKNKLDKLFPSFESEMLDVNKYIMELCALDTK